MNCCSPEMDVGKFDAAVDVTKKFVDVADRDHCFGRSSGVWAVYRQDYTGQLGAEPVMSHGGASDCWGDDAKFDAR